jgi:hypothetical protein
MFNYHNNSLKDHSFGVFFLLHIHRHFSLKNCKCAKNVYLSNVKNSGKMFVILHFSMNLN